MTFGPSRDEGRVRQRRGELGAHVPVKRKPRWNTEGAGVQRALLKDDPGIVRRAYMWRRRQPFKGEEGGPREFSLNDGNARVYITSVGFRRVAAKARRSFSEMSPRFPSLRAEIKDAPGIRGESATSYHFPLNALSRRAPSLAGDRLYIFHSFRDIVVPGDTYS